MDDQKWTQKHSGDSSFEEYEKLVELAELLYREREQHRALLDVLRLRGSFAMLLVLGGTAATLTFFESLGGLSGWQQWLVLAIVALGFVGIALFLSLTLRQTKSARQELAASERALYETVQLLRETEDVYAKDWSVLERAQFRIRLSRFGVGSDEVRYTRRTRSQEPSRSQVARDKPSAEPLAEAAVEETIDDAHDVARRVNKFAHERKLLNPFTTADLPGDKELAWETPEYKDVAARYDAHMDETLSQYGSTLLPDVVRVRGALADHGITDAELDRVFSRPRTYDDIDTITLRLWDMAGRLERKS